VNCRVWFGPRSYLSSVPAGRRGWSRPVCRGCAKEGDSDAGSYRDRIPDWEVATQMESEPPSLTSKPEGGSSRDDSPSRLLPRIGPFFKYSAAIAISGRIRRDARSRPPLQRIVTEDIDPELSGSRRSGAVSLRGPGAFAADTTGSERAMRMRVAIEIRFWKWRLRVKLSRLS
jgi:hypothetical protein